jgi:hypothetical protein
MIRLSCKKNHIIGGWSIFHISATHVSMLDKKAILIVVFCRKHVAKHVLDMDVKRQIINI